MKLLGRERPRIAMCGLNPHAGEHGDEDAARIIPAIEAARARAVLVDGPHPPDIIFLRVARGDYDMIVAMYHDQGHIALKLLGGLSAVNISVGLPLVRTSVAHGTAYDIAGRGIADATSLIEASRVAARLAR